MTTQNKRTSQYLVAVAAALVAAGGMNAALAANNATASATAVVLVPISVVKTTDLSFGRLVAGNGTVTLDTAGARTKTGSTALPTGASSTAALFTVTGDTTNSFSISYTGSSTVLSDGNAPDDMAVTFISEAVGTASPTPVSSGQAATGTLVGGNAYIYVGATLVVGASQAAGTYTGTVAVTVDYN